MDNEYSTLEIEKRLGIHRERLRIWIDRGYIEPSIQRAKGQGTKSLFSRLDVYGIGLFRELIGKGFKRDATSRLVKGFINRGIDAFAYVKFIENEGVIETEVLTPGKWALLLNTGKIGDYDPESKIINIREKSPGGNWTTILILDLRSLRQRIDAQLGE